MDSVFGGSYSAHHTFLGDGRAVTQIFVVAKSSGFLVLPFLDQSCLQGTCFQGLGHGYFFFGGVPLSCTSHFLPLVEPSPRSLCC